MWAVIEFGGGPSGRDLTQMTPISCEARRPFGNPRFRKLDGRITVSGSVEIQSREVEGAVLLLGL
jgi:hypothetical protein